MLNINLPENKNIMPLGNVFEIKKKVNMNYFIAFASNEPDYITEYYIHSGNEYIDMNLMVLKSNQIYSVSFGCGFMIYQSKWGLVLTTIVFKIDWDGERDCLIEDVIQSNYPFLIQEETYRLIEEVEMTELWNLNKNIRSWNVERKIVLILSSEMHLFKGLQ